MTEEKEVEQAEDAAVEIDAKAIEEQMLAAAEARAQDPSEMAATVYQMYMPFFDKALPKLSTRGLRRVINYLVKYPLEQGDIKSANQFEKDFMNLASSLAEAKFVILMDAYRDGAEQIYKAANEELTSDEEKEIKKLLDNQDTDVVE